MYEIKQHFDSLGARHATGLHSPAELLHDTIIVNATTEAKKNFKKYLVAICANKNVYIAKIGIDLLHACAKTSKRGDVSLFCPLSRRQVLQLIKENKLEKLCPLSELDEIKETKHCGNYGNAIEYRLAKRFKQRFDNRKPWTDEGGELMSYEVKFFTVDGSSRSQVRFTSVKQMEFAFGYDYSIYYDEENGQYC